VNRRVVAWRVFCVAAQAAAVALILWAFDSVDVTRRQPVDPSFWWKITAALLLLVAGWKSLPYGDDDRP
jgi:hypothetical protein